MNVNNKRPEVKFFNYITYAYIKDMLGICNNSLIKYDNVNLNNFLYSHGLINDHDVVAQFTTLLMKMGICNEKLSIFVDYDAQKEDIQEKLFLYSNVSRKVIGKMFLKVNDSNYYGKKIILELDNINKEFFFLHETKNRISDVILDRYREVNPSNNISLYCEKESLIINKSNLYIANLKIKNFNKESDLSFLAKLDEMKDELLNISFPINGDDMSGVIVNYFPSSLITLQITLGRDRCLERLVIENGQIKEVSEKEDINEYFDSIDNSTMSKKDHAEESNVILVKRFR